MRGKWDWLLFIQILAIGSISILIIYSINRSLALYQFAFWVTGLTILYVASQINYKFWQSITLQFYFLTLVLLALLFLLADPVRGSTRWFDFGLVRLQPSELAKAAAVFLTSHIYSNKSAQNIKNALFVLFALSPAIILIFVQPDIGNTLAFFTIWLGTSLVSGLKIKQLAVFASLLLLTLTLFVEILAPYQKQRISSFINPTGDPLGTGYNIIQSKIAIGSGKLFGKGFAQGSQSQLNFLPEAESDFIFASISEQLGLIGASLLLIIYVWMIMRIIKIAKDKDRYAQLLTAGIISFLVLQFTINVAMNMGILPVTGITFPLVSYGGSSLITTLFFLGIVFSIGKSSTPS